MQAKVNVRPRSSLECFNGSDEVETFFFFRLRVVLFGPHAKPRETLRSLTNVCKSLEYVLLLADVCSSGVFAPALFSSFSSHSFPH